MTRLSGIARQSLLITTRQRPLPKKVFAAGLVNADIAEHLILMTVIAGLTMAEHVMINVNLMVILIVMICKLVAGHRAVPRASSIASAASTSTPTSVVSSRS